jgi:hypothetical protein
VWPWKDADAHPIPGTYRQCGFKIGDWQWKVPVT